MSSGELKECGGLTRKIVGRAVRPKRAKNSPSAS